LISSLLNDFAGKNHIFKQIVLFILNHQGRSLVLAVKGGWHALPFLIPEKDRLRKMVLAILIFNSKSKKYHDGFNGR
jgi:hypothetical protein